jgi:hypothetical protein
MKYINKLFACLIVLCTLGNLHAHLPGKPSKKSPSKKVEYRTGCASSTSFVDQDLNNVRARLLGGGDCWWDFTNGRYVVPKVDPSTGQQEVSSLFAASVWLGGIDPVGNLKLACQDYRENGRDDFWPGPLSDETGTTTAETCKDWDKHFKVTGDDIRKHINNIRSGNLNPNDIPRSIKGWPAKGNPYFFDVHRFLLPARSDRGLAGFYDADGDMLYEPLDGDYPSIEIRKCEPYYRYPDEMVFWIYNDEGQGNTHGNTGGKPIQMEVQVQAFSYLTADALNDMTFQRYKLINRATDYIDSMYFAMWVDPDLGCHLDDYIGCDTIANLMYVYNQDPTDGQPGVNCPSPSGEVATYGNNIPMLGVDYFRGPNKLVLKEVPAGSGNFEYVAEEIGMSSFMYYDNGLYNSNSGMTDPEFPDHFYNYLTGTWRDGTPLTKGGSGYNIGSTDYTKYALPNSPNDLNGWSMCTAGLPFGDRRTIQASGPFRLNPGTLNELIIGVPWIADINQACPDIELLLRADKLAQGLFDNCFNILDGPDAPTVDWVEMDRQVIAVLSNSPISNNFKERYTEIDFLAPNRFLTSTDPAVKDSANFKFEGYLLYQLINPNVLVKDFGDPDKSRLVAQVDRRNNVSRIFNWEDTVDPEFPNDRTKKIFYPVEQVNGTNEGIRHTFSIHDDQFATGNAKQLINHKKYYYAVVAYAHNNYANFKVVNGFEEGQQSPFLKGGRIEIKTVIPRPVVDFALQTAYGQPVPITRLDGQGTGGNALAITDETRDWMLSPDFDGTIDYELGHGPLNINVFNPLEVQAGDYEVEFFDQNIDDNTLDPKAKWVLRQRQENGTYAVVDSAMHSLEEFNEQVFAQHGFTITVAQTGEPGDQMAHKEDYRIPPPINNGAVGAEIRYNNPEMPWLTGFPDQESSIFNYLRTGRTEKDYRLDPEQTLGRMGDGYFVPYALASGQLDVGAATATGLSRTITPAWTAAPSGTPSNDVAVGLANGNNLPNPALLRLLPNVDIVLTPDRSKWSRCIVVETANEYYTGGVNGITVDPNLSTERGPASPWPRRNFDLRYGLSVGPNDNDNDGLPDPDGAIEPDSIYGFLPSNKDKLVKNPIKGKPARGMGWFPGYAVNIETGERLNIFFGENSAYSKALDPTNTGRDMLWNPTDTYVRKDTTFGEVTDLLLGGQHWVYVANTPYDGCEKLRSRFGVDYTASGTTMTINRNNGVKDIAWAGMLALSPGYQLKTLKDGLIPDEVTVRLRVSNAYGVAKGAGNGHPRYRFRIGGELERKDLAGEQIPDALDSIKLVPNPYFAFSEYESSNTSNVVKVTNLPARCVVTIYSIDGRFIRQYKRNEQYEAYQQITPALEWDLKNNVGIPVSSGVYIFHINAYGMGERTVKWFGVTRAFDPRGL